MLQITFINDGTGTKDVGNYDYTVSVNGEEISKGRIEGHHRVFGWEGLVEDLYVQTLGPWNEKSQDDWR